jgi:2'-5' RNA ligase
VALGQVCRTIEPMAIRLATFRHFSHGGGRKTLWLAPEPADALVRLHAALLAVVPDCNDTIRNGFTPHLSVGQVTGADQLKHLLETLEARWGPLSFVVSEISLIWRQQPPNDVFQVDRTIALGV